MDLYHDTLPHIWTLIAINNEKLNPVQSSDHVTQQSHTIFNNKIALPFDEHAYHNKFGKTNFHNSQLEYIIQVKFLVSLNSSMSELIQTELKITNLAELIEA